MDANMYNVQEDSTMGDVAKSVPRIYLALDNHQEKYHTSMIEIEGKVNNLSI